MRRLLLAHFTPRPRAVRLTTEQHLDALVRVRNAEVLSYNAVHGLPSWLRRLDFDAVVLHTTFLSLRWSPWFDRWRRLSEWLADLDSVKIAFPQDEYWHADTLDSWLDDLGASVVCTVLDDTHRDELYPRLARRAAFYDVLTGYVDDEAAERILPRLVPPAERPYDVVYRARRLPYWLGSHGQLKHRIGEAVAERAAGHGLTCDISTRAQETLFGDAWLDFMGSGRSTVGAESGSSTVDRNGELQATVEELLAREPGLTFADVDARMPAGWDDFRFFAISPRHLEAVVTKTAQILVEGGYSGVLEPERHYLPVARDLSNLDEALERARDPALLEEIASRAYDDVVRSGRYGGRRLTTTLEHILDVHAPHRGRRRGLAVARRAAALEEEIERVAVAPVSNVLHAGRDAYAELLAGVRLLLSDGAARRLLADYLASTETREHVSPRVALVDLLCLGAMRGAQAGRGRTSFRVDVEADEEARRLVLHSRPAGVGADGPPTLSEDQLEQRLRSGAWEFRWEHVDSELAVPLAGGRTLRVALPAGSRRLTTLDWLARERPGHVASALAPLLE